MNGDLRRIWFVASAALAVNALPMPGVILAEKHDYTIRTERKREELQTENKTFVIGKK